MDQLLDNTSYMQDLKPLNDEEKALIKKATDIINASIDIPCTGCSYCTDGCPMQIAIPKYFSLYNADMQELRGRGITPDEGWTPQGEYYENVASTSANERVHSVRPVRGCMSAAFADHRVLADGRKAF